VGLAVLSVAAALSWTAVPERAPVVVDRDPFAAFPARLEHGWEAGPARFLEPDVERILAADDYHSVNLFKAGVTAPVDLFMAWYKDQMRGGVHSPEVCLPGAGWEIAQLERVDVSAEFGAGSRFTLNRAIIQKGTERMLVYYWFEHQGARTASGLEVKVGLMVNKVLHGRNDSAMVRLITPIDREEGIGPAEERLRDSLRAVIAPLPRFIPGV